MPRRMRESLVTQATYLIVQRHCFGPSLMGTERFVNFSFDTGPMCMLKISWVKQPSLF